MMSALLIVAAMITFTYLVVEKEAKTLSLELQKQAVALAENLAASTASYIVVKDYTTLESILMRAAEFPSILDMQVMNEGGQLLGDVYRDAEGQITVRYNKDMEPPTGRIERRIRIQDGDMVVWQPVVLGDLVGWIRTRYTMERISELKAQIWNHNIWVGSIVAIVTVLLLSLYLRKPVMVIERSTEFADQLDVYAGREIPVNHSYYELTKLTTALNRTSKNLQAKDEAINQKIREQQQLTDDLELRVLDRTAELSVARDEAINANRSKSEFLANMSHEIRTPLTAVIGFAESLLDSSQSMEERVDSINRIIHAGKHLLRIINEILDLSKIEANRLEVECIPFSLVDVFRDIYSLVKLMAMEKGLEFKVQCDFPMPAMIKSDPVRLKQILINLCNNAIKFTNEGSVTVKVSCDVEAEKLTVKVIDSGIGLTREQITKLFKPFSQADASTTRKYGGTGLGLHLSKQLAEKLGGDLLVESVLDMGSSFTMSVSTGALTGVDMVNECPDFEQVDVLVTRAANPIRLVGRVLLTEDNVDNQRLVSILLKRMGIECDTAGNGKEAIARLQDAEYDLILMDVQMPVMDGITATKLLRKKGYQIPIVALTANAMKQEQQDCLDAGCNDICTKPIAYSDFSQVMAKYLGSVIPERKSGPPIVSTLLQEEPELAALIREFVQRLPGILEKIKAAFVNGQQEELRREIHTLKGTGGNFGYSEIYELAKRIEFETVAGNFEAITELLESLDDVARRIEQGVGINTSANANVRPFPSQK